MSLAAQLDPRTRALALGQVLAPVPAQAAALVPVSAQAEVLVPVPVQAVELEHRRAQGTGRPLAPERARSGH